MPPARECLFLPIPIQVEGDIRVVGLATSDNFVIRASRQISYANTVDRISISATQNHVIVETPEALQFSLFKWLFD